MDNSKVYIDLMRNKDGKLMLCDQDGREIYGLKSFNLDFGVDSMASVMADIYLCDFGTDKHSAGLVEIGNERAKSIDEVLSMNDDLKERVNANLKDMK